MVVRIRSPLPDWPPGILFVVPPHAFKQIDPRRLTLFHLDDMLLSMGTPGALKNPQLAPFLRERQNLRYEHEAAAFRTNSLYQGWVQRINIYTR
jgi:hypothetical protein